MSKILSKRKLAENIFEFVFEAPKVVKHAKAGQFVILRADEKGERVPFSICDFDKQKGNIDLACVKWGGRTTYKLSRLNAGDLSVCDIVGPLGQKLRVWIYTKPRLSGRRH